MRITCSASWRGTIYRLYRSSDQFVAEMRGLVPFLDQAAFDVTVGGTDDDPHLVLTVGPLDPRQDGAFRERVQRFIAP